MHEKVTVTGQFGGSSSDLKYFFVSSLKTPLGLYNHSLLRSSDVISVDFGLQPQIFSNDDPVIQAIESARLLKIK